MARVAVFSSGNGSNFQAIAEALQHQGTHSVAVMVCNRKEAYSFDRARNLGIPSYYLSYAGRERREVEAEIVAYLRQLRVDWVFLAGFMKLLSPLFLDAFPHRVVNIHPALLPLYPGTHGIKESYESGDAVCGVTVHYVDYGMDSGPIIRQFSFQRDPNDSLEQFEAKIHQLEHQAYPAVVMELLDSPAESGC